MSGLAIAILAAGRARRFGGGKLDAELAGRAVGRWALAAAESLEDARVAVVAGRPAPDFARDTRIVWNLHARDGIGTSARAAARWAREIGSEALLLLLADMPLVSSKTLRALADGSLPSAVAWPGGRAGVPACFPAHMFESLAALEGDEGAARLLRGRTDVRLVEVSPEQLRDVDRPEDLADIAQILAGG